MNVITHALLPALLAAPVLPRTTVREYYASAGLVALGGALPDLLHPHLSLAARYSSWSHGVFAVAVVFAAATFAAWRLHASIRPRAFALAAGAYVLHLATDAVSGGLAWLYPASRMVIGCRSVPFAYWFVVDAALVFIALAVFLRPPKLPPREATPS